MEPVVEISAAAQDYLVKLLAQQDDGCGVRIFVDSPGTMNAETCIAYCRPGEERDGDHPLQYEKFTVWYDDKSLPYLEDTVVDFREDRMGGQITVRSPNSRVPNVGEDATLEERVNYILYSEINPGLAAHGGMVTLVEILDDDTAVLQFGGGCQGCAAVDITLKQGVETSLLAQIPDLKGIKDATDHTFKDNAYY